MPHLSDADFVDLHVHSSFSLLDGAANPEQLLERTKQLGRSRLALTDHGNVDGLVRFQKTAKKFDIKPIFGIELFMAEHWEKRNEEKVKNLHLTALAKNANGLAKIIKATGFAHRDGWSNLKKRPFLSMDYPLKNGWAGDVIILTGCASSPFWNAENGIELLSQYRDTFGSDLYAEVMPIHDWPTQKDINQMALESAEAFGVKPVLTTDIHYIGQCDSEFHEVVLGLSQLNRGMTWNNPKRWRFDSHCSYIHTSDEIVAALQKMGWTEETAHAAIVNSREVAEKCFDKIEPKPILLPRVEDCPDVEEFEVFTGKVLSGLERLGLMQEDYLERANKEIEIIKQKNFVRYMLMVADVVQWARSNGVMIGPSRGSVGGSLVAFALGITNLDPIKHRLWFERFISADRIDFPDIDVDFEDRNRHLIEEYLREKYGQYNVAHVSTYQTMLGKMAIRDVSRFYEVPPLEADKMSKMIIHRHESDERTHLRIVDTIELLDDAKKFAAKYPKVVEMAKRLEGLTKGTGNHAAGYVVSPIDLRESGDAYLVHRHDKWSINWDKDDLEHMGLIKLDILGLATLSAVSECLRLVSSKYGVKLDMAQVPLDDAKTFAALSKGETATVFQLSTPGTMNYCREMKPDNFEHLSAIPAIYKPGPIKSGAAERYKLRKLGKEEPVYFNDAHRRVTEISYGEIIYQEQIVGLLTEMAGYSLVEADKVRKIVSKQQGGAAWAEQEQKFVDGCAKTGSLDEQRARELWQSLALFSLYALNRSHAVGYSMLAYWCAYLKANYPAEWLCAYLNYGNADRENQTTGEVNRDVALREAQRLNISILPPDINKSDSFWAVDYGGRPALRVGLKDVQNVGEAALEALAKLKAAGPIIDIEKMLDDLSAQKGRNAVNKRVIESLMWVGALDGIMSQPNLWYGQFAEIFETVGRPKKRAEIMVSPKTSPPTPEELAAGREKYLRFDPWALDGSSSGAEMVKLLGPSFSLETDPEGAIQIKRGNSSWSLSDAMSCEMPDSSGVIGAAEVDLDAIRHETVKCKKCELRKSCKAPVPIEAGALQLMVVAEAPGRNEDKYGHPLIGESGEKLWAELAKLGISRSDLFVSNTVKCRPQQNAKPTPDQIETCSWLADEIKLIRPKAILALGNIALCFFKGAMKGIMDASGKTEWNHKYKCWTTFALHPASVLYHEDNIHLFRKGLAEFARVVSQFA